MTFFHHLFRSFILLVFATLGTSLAFALPSDWQQVQFAAYQQELTIEAQDIANTARAPPSDSANLAVTGTLFSRNGDARAMDGAGTQWVSLNFFGEFIATNRVGGSLTDGQRAGILREASNLPSGNRTLAGSASRAEATELGQSWVGPGYRTASDGRTLVSADGTRQYRPPSPKPNNPHSTTGVQINLETRHPETGRILSNAHVDISD